MSKFDALNDQLTVACRDEFADAATFYPLDDGEPIATSAIWTPLTEVVGDMGQALDPRPTVGLLMADVGKPKGGELDLKGRRYRLDRLVQEDGQWATYFVRDLGAAE